MILLAACSEPVVEPRMDTPDLDRSLYGENTPPPGYSPALLDLTAFLGRGVSTPGPVMTPDDAGALSPHELNATLFAGGSVTEHKVADLPDAPPKGDVLFSFDLTGSMGGELNNLKVNAVNIMTAVAGVITDVNFGLISYEDYPDAYTTSPPAQECSYSSLYGDVFSGDEPYRLDQSITGSTLDVANAINAMVLKYGADGPESYSRALFETYSDPGISWRAGAKRIVVNFGDAMPHDCDYDAIIGGNSDTGHDPGRDAVIGTADDLHILDVLNGMADANISMISLHSGGQNALWQAYAEVTGGTNIDVDFNGNFPGGADPAAEIAALILAEVQSIDELSLQACDGAPFDAWLTSSPGVINNVTLPSTQEFDLTVTVPDGTDPGVYSFDVCLFGDGAEFGRQHVTITVVPPVKIDIKPNSDPNSYGCSANGSIPVAVIGSADFDATTVDANTVRFGKNGNETGEAHQKKGEAQRHVEDYNGDGFLDMIFHFDFPSTGFTCDDIPAGESSWTLTGIMTGVAGAHAFVATDAIRLTGKK